MMNNANYTAGSGEAAALASTMQTADAMSHHMPNSKHDSGGKNQGLQY